MEVFIKHNPFTIETEFRVGGNEIASNSKLFSFKKERLQFWISDLISILHEELNEDSFKIKFQGRRLDFEDVREEVEFYNKEKNFEISLEYIEGEGSSDKENDLRDLFEDMQNGPFEELKSKEIKNKFEKALSSEFAISVIATMSSGKSTLINALLGSELMPSKNEACTATIVSIKDNGQGQFKGKVYDKENRLIEEVDDVDYEKMEELNSNPEVSLIELKGNLPFVSSDKINLVLVDTPGPNNARNSSHRDHTYRIIKEESKPMVLYVLNVAQFATNDDSTLLEEVAEQMKVGGKQSKDRFIFAVNKVDLLDPERGESIEESLNEVRKYLQEKGIKNPNIFPVSAELAKVIRLNQQGKNLSRNQKRTLYGIDLFNDEEEMHLLKYVPLINSLKNDLYGEIAAARESNDEELEALQHCGITAIEAAINEYIEKYAIAVKIKHAVDSFKKVVEQKRMMQNLQDKMKKDSQKREEIHRRMNIIGEELAKGEQAKEFKEKIMNLNIDKQDKIAPIRDKIERKIYNLSEKFKNNKVTIPEAKALTDAARVEIKSLQSNILTDLEKLVPEVLRVQATELLAEYKGYVEGLIDVEDEDINLGEEVELFTKNLPNPSQLVEKYQYSQKKWVGDKWVKNPDRKWYKPWTFFTENKGWNKGVFEDRTYVNTTKLAEEFIKPVKKNLYQNIENAKNHIDYEAESLKDYFLNEIDKLDQVLKDKVSELKELSSNKSNLEERLAETEEKREWLDRFILKLDKILEV
ncbi:dynamin family protein [Halonatronum saccharophilum]|uniref:dynamin family protein n=1 Tax=Halonatronum saccharophilum TaxID=150060 RepID=UPI00048010AD|nr:dynamin family protein [Halonatronum saccharophilum]